MTVLPGHLKRNESETAIIRQIAEDGNDRPALMLNISSYKPEAGYPDGALYRQYISVLESVLATLGARILWQLPIHGQAVGEQKRYDEVLAIWFPSHAAFLGFGSAPGAEENYRLRAMCLDYAVIHRCPGDAHEWNVEAIEG